ncbi:hypothetical protein HR060_13040 [Catenovulum sp. SM1970]|uniref:hypothetical protein n=1 Tax=Marinifaba aquimaris TaxID=2741323 RepID=UPI001574A256|nr:hypothetical protein [Marinifaba aquimaris]NTS77784.1 hypothetical protein [Marinifaba aquimaris]
MQLKDLFKLSAITAALVLAGCGGDIKIDATEDAENIVVKNPEPSEPTEPTDPVVEYPAESPITKGLATRDAALSDRLGKEVYTVEGTITEEIYFHNDVVWALNGAVFIGQDSAEGTVTEGTSVLSIQAGTTVIGKSGADVLVVSRGSRIEAAGTAADPIVFTSFQDAEGTVDPADSGLWGGLVINGRAPNSKGDNVPGEANTGTYGGDIADDNSGTLRYVQVRFAGFKVDGENELNGIAFQSVGSATTVEYIQVHNNSDDGVEFFGGTVNAKYVVLTGNQDDSMDWTQGWTGKVQHVYIKQNNEGGDHGFEGDGSGSADSTPNSMPQIANITFLGGTGEKSNGMDIRKGSQGAFYNFAFKATNDNACLDIDDADALGYAADGSLDIQYSFLECANNYAEAKADGFDATAIQTWFEGTDTDMNRTGAAQLVNYMPAPSSPLLGTGLNVANEVDSFFDEVNYVGAFDGENDWTLGWTYGIHNTVSQCPSGTVEVASVDGSTLTCAISGTVKGEVTLSPGAHYQLSGAVFVGDDTATEGYTSADAGVLNIEPGVTVFGQSGADYLVVSRGSQINAVGTAQAPVVMTSYSDVIGTVAADDSGLWGGLIINGQAPNSKGANVPGEANTGTYGGDIADDNSGALKYLQVKFAGFKVDGENELNGIAFQSVGSATEVDYIQVHNNSDDGVEFFGGSVNVKHLVLTGNQDDSLDWTQGWTGKVQHVLIKQNDVGGDHAFEGDGSGSADSTPNSMPTIANVTYIGSAVAAKSNGMDIRKGSQGHFYNFVFDAKSENSCLDIDDADAKSYALDGSLSLQTSAIDCVKPFAGEGEVEAWFNMPGNNEQVSGIMVDEATFVPASTGTVTATDMSTVDAFFDATDYIGGVRDASDEWWKGWTAGL